MKIFDAHCDVLMKLFNNPNENFLTSPALQVTKHGMERAGVKIQLFAIYVPEAVYHSLQFEAALAMVQLFYEKIIHEAGLKLILDKEDLRKLGKDDIGAILTLEGCDSIGGDVLKLKTLLRLGVTSVGLTWNWANLVADGALETRGAGLTKFGKEVINILESQKVWLDVSHLSERAFWEVIDLHSNPIASHSNSRKMMNHPRNLTDDQLKALFLKKSIIGITFVPEFLTEKSEASIKDIMKHIEHICTLGGSRHIGFGSDFDGTDKIVKGLENVSQYDNLVNQLLIYYPESVVRGFLYENFVSAYLEK